MTVIKLTSEQINQFSNVMRGKVTVTLTREQYEAIKKDFPQLTERVAEIAVATSGVAAPFLPGGSVITASITKVGRSGRATGSLG